MKSIVLLLMVAGSLIAGCVVEEPRHGYRDDARYGDRNDGRYQRDRDRDGVPNRDDRRPDDPRRY